LLCLIDYFKPLLVWIAYLLSFLVDSMVSQNPRLGVFFKVHMAKIAPLFKVALRSRYKNQQAWLWNCHLFLESTLKCEACRLPPSNSTSSWEFVGFQILVKWQWRHWFQTIAFSPTLFKLFQSRHPCDIEFYKPTSNVR
jgi:hypothetical protein